MDTPKRQKRLKRVVFSLPEIWFSFFFLSGIYGSIRSLILDGWQTSTVIPLLLIVAITGILIKQIFSTNCVISKLTGSILSLASLYMILALLSEYSEFPKGDPKGLTMLFAGLFLIGGSLILAISMLLRHTTGKDNATTYQSV